MQPRHDAEVKRTNGEPIPQLELHYPPYLLENYQELIQNKPLSGLLPADPAFVALPPSQLALQSADGTLRTENPADFSTADFCDRSWEGAFFVTLARNFGFGVNSDAFELWAKHIPLAAVNKHRDDLFQIEAIFFGQAGLLQELPADDYTEKLMKEYAYLAHKFDLTPAEDCRWKFLRMRPGNFPHVRIAQLACLYHRSQGMFSRLMELETLQELREIFKGGTSVYWLTHYVFGQPSPSHPKTLSQSSIDLLIINTVIPFLYAYGKHKGEERLCNRASLLLEDLKPENNYITRMWEECGLKAAHAGDSQALIQLKKNYCDSKKCLYCRIGYEYFKKEQKE